MSEKFNISREENPKEDQKNIEKEFSFEKLEFKEFKLIQETPASILATVVRGRDPWPKSDKEMYIQKNLLDFLDNDVKSGIFKPAKAEDLDKIDSLAEGVCIYAFGDYKSNEFVTRQWYSAKELGGPRMTYKIHTLAGKPAEPLTPIDGDTHMGLDIIVRWLEKEIPYRNSNDVGKLRWLEKLTMRGDATDRLPDFQIVLDYVPGEGQYWLCEGGSKPMGLEYIKRSNPRFSIKTGKSPNNERIIDNWSGDEMPKDLSGNIIGEPGWSHVPDILLPIGSRILFVKNQR